MGMMPRMGSLPLIIPRFPGAYSYQLLRISIGCPLRYPVLVGFSTAPRILSYLGGSTMNPSPLTSVVTVKLTRSRLPTQSVAFRYRSHTRLILSLGYWCAPTYCAWRLMTCYSV